MKILYLIASFILHSLWYLPVNAASQIGDAFDHVKMEYIPEGTRWIEIGFFVITPDNWTTVSATYSNFVDPVVFLSLPQLAGDTSQEGVAQALRVNNTNLDRIDASTSYYSFDAKIFDVNTTFCSTRTFYTPRDLQVNSSFIGWIVVEKGKFNVSSKAFIIQTDRINRTDDQIREDPRNTFRSFAPFGICDGGQDCAMTGVAQPRLLTIGQLLTTRYNLFLLLRAVGIDRQSVQWVLQPHDSLDPLGYYFPDPGEDYAWMMFEDGLDTTCIEDLAIESHKYFVTYIKQPVVYTNTFLIPPALFGMIKTLGGRDSVSLRMFDLTVTGSTFITQEDKCAKEETNHIFAEEAGVLVIGRTASVGTTVCGATFNDNQPTRFPTASPTIFPTGQPSEQPSGEPSGRPSEQPSGQPSTAPSGSPTSKPSSAPTASPTGGPTASPTAAPSAAPSSSPSAFPTAFPTLFPTAFPSAPPSNETYCVEITLFDTFGDGWGDNIALKVWGPEYGTEYIYFDSCVNGTDFPVTICYAADTKVYFDIIVFNPPATESWEIFWTLKTLGQTNNIYDSYGAIFVPRYYLGDFDTNMTVINADVEVWNPVNTANQTCKRCKHPPKPKPRAGPPKASPSFKEDSAASGSSDSNSTVPVRELIASNSSSTGAGQDGTGAGGKPKPPHWPFPVTIFDESGAGWFNGSEAWVMVPEYECDGSVSYSDNRRLPEVVTNPEYVISTIDRTKVLRRNTICGDLLKETCEERLPDGEYIFRVGGALSRDHTANNSAWDFCGVRGRSMEELAFSMRKGKCVAGNKLSARNLCCNEVTARAAIYDGVIVLKNVAGDTLSEFDTSLLENALAESFSTVNAQLHSSVSLSYWEMQGSALTVNFRLAFDPSEIGISINHYVVLEELTTRLASSSEEYMESGNFLSTLRTGLAGLPLSQGDVLIATSGVSFVSLVYVDAVLESVHASVSTVSLALRDPEMTLSTDVTEETQLSSMSAFEHTSVVVIASIALTAFALVAFTVLSRSYQKKQIDELSESADAFITEDAREVLEMGAERSPDLY